MEPDPVLIVVAAIAVVVLVVVVRGVRIVHPFERGVVERLGRFRVVAEPGLRLIIPLVDTLRRVDMREQVVDVQPQEVITKDNVVVSVDAVIYFEPTDPQRLVYNVANFLLAVTKLAQTNLRNVVGDMQLDEALTSRDSINTQLRLILDEATDTWGVRVKRVEIQRIDPPRDVMEAMHAQMRAERERRAVVLTADGEREAAIAVAEGHKRSAILQAEGDAEALQTMADAEAYQRTKVAEAEAAAITMTFGAITAARPTDRLVQLKALEALGVVANGQATKVYLPGDLAGVARIAEMLSGAREPASGQK
jgi:regulator of protease activity HflC (stomatin/prohibitin superfamily)